jgi:hypothetical protein
MGRLWIAKSLPYFAAAKTLFQQGKASWNLPSARVTVATSGFQRQSGQVYTDESTRDTLQSALRGSCDTSRHQTFSSIRAVAWVR